MRGPSWLADWLVAGWLAGVCVSEWVQQVISPAPLYWPLECQA